MAEHHCRGECDMTASVGLGPKERRQRTGAAYERPGQAYPACPRVAGSDAEVQGIFIFIFIFLSSYPSSSGWIRGGGSLVPKRLRRRRRAAGKAFCWRL